jgi:rod shape-determining protein MreC
MSTTTTQQKAPWLLGLILFSQVILMSWMARRPDSDQSVLRAWVMAVLSPPVRGVNWVFGSVTGAVAAYVDLKGARARNVDLQTQVERLTEERDEARALAADNERLRAQLGLPSLPQYRRLSANVVSRDTSLWFRRLIIDRGTLDGVKLDLPVATATGIVGRVIAVGPNFAQVQVITDRHAGAGAMLVSSGEKGEVHGMDNGRCELKDVSSAKEVSVGDSVVTTGQDGIYPRGLMIGTVEAVENDPNAPWHKIVVNPSAPTDRLDYVMVLLIEPKDLKMVETIK